jgi:hypothetical protein
MKNIFLNIIETNEDLEISLTTGGFTSVEIIGHLTVIISKIVNDEINLRKSVEEIADDS